MIYFLCSMIAIEPCNKMGAIRLTHGASNTGRLEVCSGGNWGSVCGFEAANDIAEVACRQLNHAAQGMESIISNSAKLHNYTTIQLACDSIMEFI